MFCKWCGLESETNDVCSWCRKPFSSAAAPAKPPTAPAAPVTPTYSAPPALSESFDDEPPPPSDFVPAAAPPSSAALPVASGAFPLGDSFDDIDDDLSPMPFGGASYQPPAQTRSYAAPPSYVPPAP